MAFAKEGRWALHAGGRAWQVRKKAVQAGGEDLASQEDVLLQWVEGLALRGHGLSHFKEGSKKGRGLKSTEV